MTHEPPELDADAAWRNTDYYGDALKAFVAGGYSNPEMCAALTAQLSDSIAEHLPDDYADLLRPTAEWTHQDYFGWLRLAQADARHRNRD